MNEQRIGPGAQLILRSKYQRFMPTEIVLIFGKFEGYLLSGIGSRSVPFNRQAGTLSDENVISLEIFKILKYANVAAFCLFE